MRHLGVLLFLGIISNLLIGKPCFALEPLKKTVAVFEFENDSGWYGQDRLGYDFSDQLSDALVKNGKFIVLSRKNLAAVLTEQEMASTDRFAAADKVKTGKVVPAQILIKGKITEFKEKTSGGEQNVRLYGVRLNSNKSVAYIALIIQLINSTTGEIIDSQRIEGEAASGGVSVKVSAGLDLGSSSFQKTPLGKATQLAISRAVDFIARKSSDIPWSGKIVMVKDGLVYINSGANCGIKEGATFPVFKVGDSLVDPDSGLELGQETKKIGQLKITEVQEKFSKATVIGKVDMEISKGDMVAEN